MMMQRDMFKQIQFLRRKDNVKSSCNSKRKMIEHAETHNSKETHMKYHASLKPGKIRNRYVKDCEMRTLVWSILRKKKGSNTGFQSIKEHSFCLILPKIRFKVDPKFREMRAPPARATNPRTGGQLTPRPAGANPRTGQAAETFF